MYYRRTRKYTANNIQYYLPGWIASGCKNKFYGLAIWTEKRNEVMSRDRCLCQDCLAHGVISQADVVHHIQYLDQRPDLALDDNNLISLCKFCHKVRHFGIDEVLERWDEHYPAWVPQWMYAQAQARRAAKAQQPMQTQPIQTQPRYPAQPVQTYQPAHQSIVSNQYQYQQQTSIARQTTARQVPHLCPQYTYQPNVYQPYTYQSYNPYVYQPYSQYAHTQPPGTGGEYGLLQR